jgi:hypothetical protein
MNALAPRSPRAALRLPGFIPNRHAWDLHEPRSYGLLEAQRLHRVEARRPPSRADSEGNSDGDGDAEC